MRHFLLLASAASLSACSLFEQPPIYHNGYDVDALSGAYGQAGGGSDCGAYGGSHGAAFGNCGGAGGYSVASGADYAQNSLQNFGPAQPYNFNGAPSHKANYQGVNFQGPGFQGPNAAYGQIAGLRGLRGRSGYGYANVGTVIYDIDNANYGLTGRLGYSPTPYFAGEVEGSLNLKHQDIFVTNGSSKVTGTAGVEYNVAAFALARLPINPALSLHARAGFDHRRVDINLDDPSINTKTNDTLDGFAYGIGGEFSLSPQNAVRLDYTRYENDISEFDSISAAYVRKF